MSVQPHRPTVISIAAIAFIVADDFHETLGHGIGFLLAGGQSGILTTTRLVETQRLGDRGGDIFDIGGPFGNLLCAALSWLALRFIPRLASRLRLFLTLTLAFSLFWAFGYLAFCGVKAQGDWFALIRAVPNQWIWRVVLFVVGLALYIASIRLVASQFPWTKPLRLACYLSGGTISILGALLDPRGLPAMRHDALLSGFGAALGMLMLSTSKQQADSAINRSFPWIIAAIAASVFYILVLGPGIHFTL